MNSTLLILLALAGAWLIWKKIRNRNVPHILPAEVREKLKDRRSLFLLDVRSKRETARRKMKGAVCIPLHELPSRLEELEPHRGKEFVVVCASGTRSVAGARILQSSGFNASSMRGGLMAWRDQ